MQKIVCLLEINEEEKAAFREAAGENEIVFINSGKREFVSSVSGELFADADVIIGQPKRSELKYAKKLKWLQARASGVDNYLEPGKVGEDVIITSATGAYGVSVAEQVFAQMLGIMKRLPQYRDNQRAALWRDQGDALSPEGMNILIFGTGDLGSTFARYCKAFGAHTIGIRRDPSRPADGIDEMHGMDEADELLKSADVVCSLLPHSDDMVGYFSYERFMSMKQNAVFLNAGRGPVVDTMGLYRALEEGHLFGAGIDTVDPEPLPQEHPLWKQPRLSITPHTAGGDHLDSTLSKVTAIALDNLKHYLAGEPLINRKR